MKLFKKIINFIVKIPVYFYKGVLSPILPHSCRFYPTCSSYFLEAVDKFGPFKGFCLGIKRILRCNPITKVSGYDPVPNNIKGDFKWLL